MNHRIAFFGGKPLSARCLERLYRFHVRGQLEIVGVCCRAKGERGWWSGPGVPEMYETAETLGLPILSSEEELLTRDADLGLSVLHHRILPGPLVRHPRSGFLNLHLAPLPQYRGCNVCTHALMNGETRFGVTLHRMDERPDHGDVIAVRWFDIPPEATARDLMALCEHAAFDLFCSMLPAMVGEALPGRPQDDIIRRDGVATHYYRRDSLSAPEAKLVDLSWPAEKLVNHIRALDFPPFEPAHAIIAGRKVHLTMHGRNGTV